MKLGFGLGYSGAHMDLPMADILRAEILGWESVWTAESYGSDALTPLAFIAGQTKKLRFGTSVVQLAARSAANLAMSAQTIDDMAGRGRMIVGLGVSGPQIVEGWYGEPWGKPAERLRDYVAIMKKIWKREGPVTHAGSEIALPYTGPGASGLGKPLKSILHGNPDIPVLLGTSTPGNIRLAGEIGDGWLSMSWYPGAMKTYGPLLEQGLAKRSDELTLKDFDITAIPHITLMDDVRQAMDKEKPGVALYVGGMGAKGKNFHKEKMAAAGFPEAAERIQELYMAGRKDEAAQAVPDEYIDLVGLMGPAERIRERWQAWADSGASRFVVMHPTRDVVELLGTFI